MANTKEGIDFQQNRIKQRSSRIQQTRKYILAKTSASYLNNIHWYEILSWLDENAISFQIKTLLSGEVRHCNFIKELEETSVLIDNSGDFIEFLELEKLKCDYKDNFVKFLDEYPIPYLINGTEIEIVGYELNF